MKFNAYLVGQRDLSVILTTIAANVLTIYRDNLLPSYLWMRATIDFLFSFLKCQIIHNKPMCILSACLFDKLACRDNVLHKQGLK